MIWFLFFFYIYPIVFMGIPLSTRIFFSLVGIGLFIIRKKISRHLVSVLCGLLPMSIVSICSGIFNHTYDFQFFFYAFSQVAIFFAAYFLSCQIKVELMHRDLLCFINRYVVLVIALQSILTVCMYFFNGFGDFMRSLISMDELSNSVYENTEGTRFLGWGSYFFGAGVINGLGLILVVYLYLSGQIKAFICSLFYVVILLVGILMARTTLIGFVVSLLFLLSWRWNNVFLIKRKIKWILSFGLILSLLLVAVFYLVDTQILFWAFELFFNLIENGEFSTDSTDALQTMYVLPFSIKTYIIGDGLFSLGNSYYMDTDVGFLRLLYYGGIPAVIAYYFYSYWIVRKTINLGISSLSRRLLCVLFLYTLILNVKGLVDLNQILILIYIVVYQAKNKNIANYGSIQIGYYR